MTRRVQAGFTLIEMMVAMLITSLVVIMTLSIFGRLSFAYREQQQITSVQQVLAAVRAAIENDAKQAGLNMSQGFKLAVDGSVTAAPRKLHSPVVVINNNNAPDQVAFYYADPTVQAVVVSPTLQSPNTPVTVWVDDATGFTQDMVVALVQADTSTMSNPISAGTDAKITTFDTCIVQIATIAGNQLTFRISGDWGRPGNDHCTPVVNGQTMVYRFVSRAWRIDPSRLSDNVLQLEPNGDLVNTKAWQDMAYNVSDMQVSTYFFDDDGVDSPDPDTDVRRDWVSSEDQEVKTAPLNFPGTFVPPLMMSMSLVSRTDQTVEGVFTSATPALIDTANPYNNMIGDRPSVALPSTTDDRLKGNRIYRYITFQMDMRNMGVGR